MPCFFSATFLLEVKPTKLYGETTSNYKVTEKSRAFAPQLTVSNSIRRNINVHDYLLRFVTRETMMVMIVTMCCLDIDTEHAGHVTTCPHVWPVSGPSSSSMWSLWSSITITSKITKHMIQSTSGHQHALFTGRFGKSGIVYEENDFQMLWLAVNIGFYIYIYFLKIR